MRQCYPLQKDFEKVLIPADLLAFLKEMHRMIVAGEEEATIESDDLIQCETAYAGLIEEGRSEFGITYFPNHTSKGIRDKWELVLNKEEIANIADGLSNSLQLWSFRSEECGCRFTVADETCFYCDWKENDA